MPQPFHCLHASDMRYVLSVKDPFQSAANVPASGVSRILALFLLLF